MTRTTKRREPLRRDPSRVADKRSEDARIVSVCCVWQPDAMGRARGRTVTAPHSLRLRPRRQLDPSQNRLVLWCFGAQKQPRMSRRRGQEAKASIEHKARSARPKNPYSFEVFQNFTYRLIEKVRVPRSGARTRLFVQSFPGVFAVIQLAGAGQLDWSATPNPSCDASPSFRKRIKKSVPASILASSVTDAPDVRNMRQHTSNGIKSAGFRP